jgi:hypothetical protein
MEKEKLKEFKELIVKEMTRTELEERLIELYEKYNNLRVLVEPSNENDVLSTEDIKWVIYYGQTWDKRIFLDDEKSGLDYFLEDAFKRNETFKKIEEIFWDRIRKLVENYR